MTATQDRKQFFYESFAGEWDSQMNQDELGKRLRLVFHKLLTPEDVHGKRVLDAGAGTGHFSRVLAGWGADLVSLDLGPQLLTQVSKKCATRGVVGSCLQLPFADRSFDVVFSTEVVEHTTEPRLAVSELCRVVTPGGLLLLTTPNRVWHPAIVAATKLGLRPYHGNENWVRYAEMRGWIGQAGLQIEDQRGFNVLPHTVFCKKPFDFLDAIRPLHPLMINMAVRARRPT